jgi:hypothetical protein
MCMCMYVCGCGVQMYHGLLGRQNAEVADTLLHLVGVLEAQQEGNMSLAMYKVSPVLVCVCMWMCLTLCLSLSVSISTV